MSRIYLCSSNIFIYIYIYIKHAVACHKVCTNWCAFGKKSYFCIVN